MVFSTTVFLFIFLPLLLVGNSLLPHSRRNIWLLLGSLVFYAWGEGLLVLLMLGIILITYCGGHFVHKALNSSHPWHATMALWLSVLLVLFPLIYFKYFNFFFENISKVLDIDGDSWATIPLPIGISFFTFQSISYLVDVYQKKVEVQKKPHQLALYIALFPQLIAGPIVRYREIALQIKQRATNTQQLLDGIVRFSMGMAKKVIIANQMGSVADQVFNISNGDMHFSLAWIGIICYTLQLYFDFSGYSDMAIGLGKMFGFDFLENFNYPYISKSIKEFWQRWHISLSRWFKDYLYIPLGGNRKGIFRTYINLSVVFFLTGLWHGASWNFIVWGLWHGVFLIIEKSGRWPLFSGRIGNCFAWFYTIGVVMIGWVFFRSENLTYAWHYLQSLAGQHNINPFQFFLYLDNYTITIACAAFLLATPLRKKIFNLIFPAKALIIRFGTPYNIVRYCIALGLLLYSVMEIASSTYNPFLYFRF